MAFKSNDNQQLSLNDSTFNLTEREQKFLEKSWAKPFAEQVFPAIDEDMFSVLYSDKVSRPNTPINVIVGALILKESLGDTDDELVQALMFDVRYQYALHTSSFEEQPLSDRSLSRFRARCLAYEERTGIDLIHECIIKMSGTIADFMGITPDMQRMDSLMIAANIKNLSLLELFYTCVANLVKKMTEREVEIPKEQQHYIEKDDCNRFIYHRRNIDSKERTLEVMRDAEKLIELCDDKFDDTSEYQLLIRLLKERTIIDGDGTRRLRKKKEIEEPSKVLLNPSDSEATFRYKGKSKHRGYVANITESVGNGASIITDFSYEQNIHSDSQFLNEYLKKQPKYEEEKVLVVDGGYSGELNIAAAADHNIKLVATNFTGIKPDDIFADFEFSTNGEVLLKCANGVTPTHSRYDKGNDTTVALFPLEACSTCPYQEKCHPKFQKRNTRKEVSWKTANRARQLRYMNTEDFKELAKFRNGVEANPSIFRRRYNVDKIPVRGKRETRLHFAFKVAALNVQKLLDYINGLDKRTLETKIA